MSTSININEESVSVAKIQLPVNESDVSEENEACCKNSDIPATLKGSTKESGINHNNQTSSYASNKNTAEGLMDIALLSANANQLRFLITYNHNASTYYISITLVALSLIMQILVGIALIFKRRFRKCRNKRYNELILGGVFIITVVNILLAAFTTTDVI